MSDLCAPVYIVMGADEELTFWCFVGIMDRMVCFHMQYTYTNIRLTTDYPTRSQKQNFLRDQSGMKKQLSTLQQLIGVMDTELYRHLGTSLGFECPILAIYMRYRENGWTQFILLLPVRRNRNRFLLLSMTLTPA